MEILIIGLTLFLLVELYYENDVVSIITLAIIVYLVYSMTRTGITINF